MTFFALGVLLGTVLCFFLLVAGAFFALAWAAREVLSRRAAFPPGLAAPYPSPELETEAIERATRDVRASVGSQDDLDASALQAPLRPSARYGAPREGIRGTCALCAQIRGYVKKALFPKDRKARASESKPA